ncbi:MAG: DUF1127 domain-containing protein [Pseudomonas oryzihabitans]
MAQLTSRHLSASQGKTSSGWQARLIRLSAWLSRALEVSRQRRALYRLDDAALSDLGLSRADAWQEADKPFWEQPAEEVRRRSC